LSQYAKGGGQSGGKDKTGAERSFHTSNKGKSPRQMDASPETSAKRRPRVHASVERQRKSIPVWRKLDTREHSQCTLSRYTLDLLTTSNLVEWASLQS
jgi:hypothetical protein